ncbi:MAG: hypothetical protein J6D14_05580, partial [Lachnospiraceae bacterium]|nr:hypothetical protein [Lachnospiraceae bacterium]MBP3913859.1 hypothetical protein [Lachnospiraceae bacterium]
LNVQEQGISRFQADIQVGDIAIKHHQHKPISSGIFLYCSEVEPEAENRAAACGLPLTGSGRDDKI